MIFDAPLNRNFQAIPRRFGGLCVRGIGYAPQKTMVMDQVFTSFNYSLILSGSGSYSAGGQSFSVESPCVITQQPGVHASYGPAVGETWEEIYFILPAEKFEILQARGMVGERVQGWPIRNLPAVISAIRALLPLLETPANVDLIDHLTERVIMETLLPGEESSDPASAAVGALVQLMNAAPRQSYDFEELAHDHGISYSTFQRRWRELHTEPPGQYLLNLRISESCRLLAETDLGIADIGQQCGFDDPAYFSRIFSRRIGMPPSAYRIMHRFPSLGSPSCTRPE